DSIGELGVNYSKCVTDIALDTALIHMAVGILIPLLLACFLTGFFGPQRNFAQGLKVWPFAIYASLAMTVPSVTVAWLLGPEFPSLIGGLVGLVLVLFTSSKVFLMPREIFDFGSSASWDKGWIGHIAQGVRRDPMKPH